MAIDRSHIARRVIGALHPEVGDAEVVVAARVVRRQLDHALVGGLRFGPSAIARQKETAERVVGQPVVRPRLDGFPVGRFGVGEAVDRLLRAPQLAIGLAADRIELDRALRDGDRLFVAPAAAGDHARA